ncbi:MAG TPA: MBG domain-containing protein, partial [Mucilaginibacter sp.]|nr:MBG domain-containing protein [Mucilaginibacter sp.]
LTYTSANLSITQAAITVTADAKTKVYGQSDPALTYQITSGALVGSDVFTGSLTRDPGENVGSYVINQGTLALNGNYTLTYAPANLTITAAAITITADAKTKTYGQSDPALTYQITSGSLITGDSFTGSLTRDPGENVGSYAINQGTLALNGNYTLTYAGASLTITAAILTITANNQSKAYGQANPELTMTYTGFVNGDGASKLIVQPTISTTATTNSPINTYPIIISGAASANYSINYVPGTLTIAAATLTITADDQVKTYGEVNPILTVHYSGFVGSDDVSKLSTLPSIITTASTASGAGEYTIAASGAVMQNYTVVYQSGVLTIKKAPLTVTADNQSRLYGAANPELTISYSGFVDGDDASNLSNAGIASTTAGANTPLGTYPITVKGAASPNYAFTYVPGALTIMPLTDASLSQLVVNEGKATLSPDFSPTVYDYTATVENDVDWVDVTALFASTSTAQINGNVLYNNRTSNHITLQTGYNTITVTITAQNGSQHTYIITIYRGLPAAAITATNILTPNGDGKNDTWVVKDIDLYPNNTVSVYDRAGRLVYSKHGYQNDWDGTLKGSPLTQGTYYYTIDLGVAAGVIKGFITIIRE